MKNAFFSRLSNAVAKEERRHARPKGRERTPQAFPCRSSQPRCDKGEQDHSHRECGCLGCVLCTVLLRKSGCARALV